MPRYVVFSYRAQDEAGPYQIDHGQLDDRDRAERICRELVMQYGRRMAHVMRSDGDVVYMFDRDEALGRVSVTWTADLAEMVLDIATPTAPAFLRAIIDAGGEASVERVKEATGLNKLNGVKMSINTAAKKVARTHLDGQGPWFLVESIADTTISTKTRVISYRMLPERIAAFEEALRRRDY